jgi:hypothetical protein
LLLRVVAFLAGITELFASNYPMQNLEGSGKINFPCELLTIVCGKRKPAFFNAGSNTTHLRLAIQPIHRG